MENRYRNLNEVTPQEMQCLVGACPAIYEAVKEITPQEMQCIAAACPSAYEATRKGKGVYLIIGKSVNPLEAGLEKKVGKDEALIEISKAIIDNRKK